MFQDIDALFVAVAAERTAVVQRANRVGPHLGEAAARSQTGGSVAALLARATMVLAAVRSAARRTVGLGVRLRPSVVR